MADERKAFRNEGGDELHDPVTGKRVKAKETVIFEDICAFAEFMHNANVGVTEARPGETVRQLSAEAAAKNCAHRFRPAPRPSG